MSFNVELCTVHGAVTSLGSAGPHTVVIDRPVEYGGGGKGFNGGQLLHLAVGACISNDLFREAKTRHLTLTRVAVTVDGDFGGSPPVSTGIRYRVTIDGPHTREELDALVDHVDAIAEIPLTLRRATPVTRVK